MKMKKLKWLPVLLGVILGLQLACTKMNQENSSSVISIKKDAMLLESDYDNMVSFVLREYGNQIAVFDMTYKGVIIINDIIDANINNAVSERGSGFVNWELGVAIIISDDEKNIKIFHTKETTLLQSIEQLLDQGGLQVPTLIKAQRLSYDRADYHASGISFQGGNVVDFDADFTPNDLDDLPVNCGCIPNNAPQPTNCNGGGPGSTSCNVEFTLAAFGGSASAKCSTTCGAGTYACCSFANDFEYN